jgi:hypothetical protein
MAAVLFLRRIEWTLMYSYRFTLAGVNQVCVLFYASFKLSLVVGFGVKSRNPFGEINK